MKQHTLAAIGFAAWALFAVAGIASPAQAHEYTYACPGSGGVLVAHPSQCNAPSPTADDGESAKPSVPLKLAGKTTRNCPKGGGTTNDEHYGCNKDIKADTVAAS